MTAARYENTWARNKIELAVKTLGIPLTVSGGVFYGQCMQKMMQQCCDAGVEIIVTIDGDSIFTPDQMRRLLNIACQQSEIDAITGVQLRRGKPDMLGTVFGKTEVVWDGFPIKARTAHFGLTVIKAEKLRLTPKPWFASLPNENGDWEDDKIDDDVNFWFQWEKAGNSLYIDPGTRLGHLEEMIVIHDENLQPKHVYPADWETICGSC